MSLPNWILQSHQYKRTVIDRVDGMRVDVESRHKKRMNQLESIQRSLTESLIELKQEMYQDWQVLNHASGRFRQELKFLPVLPLPGSWSLPEFQLGSRVYVSECKLVATVVGLLYYDGSDRKTDYVGWGYFVKFDYAPLPHDDVEMYCEDELKLLGAITHCDCNAPKRPQAPESVCSCGIQATSPYPNGAPLGNSELFQDTSESVATPN